MTDFEIIPATMADRPRIVDFLRAAFYKYEPLNNAMGLTDEPSDADIDHSLQSLPQGNSLMAVAGGRILGVAINGEITDKEVEVRKKLYDECTCKAFSTFLKFWVHVEKEANIWPRISATKALDLEILAVDPATRGRGIGNALIGNAKGLAKSLGYEVFRMDCSSFYAAKLAEHHGMNCVFEMNYDDYKDIDGNTIFNIPAPHKALRIFIQKL